LWICRGQEISTVVTLAACRLAMGLGDGVFVGDSGSDNRLVVSNGSSLVTRSISYLGTEITSSNNEGGRDRPDRPGPAIPCTA